MNIQGKTASGYIFDDLYDTATFYAANEVPAVLDRMEQKLRVRRRDYSVGLSLKEREMFATYSSFRGTHSSRTKFHRSQVLRWIEETRASWIESATNKLAGGVPYEYQDMQWAEAEIEKMLAPPRRKFLAKNLITP